MFVIPREQYVSERTNMAVQLHDTEFGVPGPKHTDHNRSDNSREQEFETCLCDIMKALYTCICFTWQSSTPVTCSVHSLNSSSNRSSTLISPQHQNAFTAPVHRIRNVLVSAITLMSLISPACKCPSKERLDVSHSVTH